jgi:hypothetical protein
MKSGVGQKQESAGLFFPCFLQHIRNWGGDAAVEPARI